MSTFRNLLSLDHEPKVVPYGGSGEPRPDGDANYGFKDLKCNPELISTIPELTRDPDLLEAVRAINEVQVGLFSVGCTSGPVSDSQGFRRTGYVEFALNAQGSVGSASEYFPLFFHFDRALSVNRYSGKVAFQWELKTAQFTDVGMAGYTCSVFVNTFYHPTEEQAAACWSEAMAVLAEFLSSVPVTSGPQLYERVA